MGKGDQVWDLPEGRQSETLNKVGILEILSTLVKENQKALPAGPETCQGIVS